MRASDVALSQCDGIIQTYLECIDTLNALRRELYTSTHVRKPTLASETIRLLVQYQFDRTLGAYCLIVNGLVWDAEIIIRSVYETSVKIIFLGASSKEKRDELAQEYWGSLLSIYDRKGAAKAGMAERLAKEFSEADLRVFQALKNSEFFNTEGEGNKRHRDEVENRWAFSAIIKTLSSTSLTHERVIGLDSLAHLYGMMSHLAHASPKSLELMEDRATRTSDLVGLESTHICRMLNDLVSLGCFSLRFAQCVEYEKTPNEVSVSEAFQKMSDAGRDIRAAFNLSQDELYNKY